eukprot:s379_g47.t1
MSESSEFSLAAHVSPVSPCPLIRAMNRMKLTFAQAAHQIESGANQVCWRPGTTWVHWVLRLLNVLQTASRVFSVSKGLREPSNFCLHHGETFALSSQVSDYTAEGALSSRPKKVEATHFEPSA